jgi:putative nucleotidyltransferase with HDIG domain
VVVAKLEEKVLELEEMFIQVVKVLVNLLDAKSPWTMGHSERVAEFAEMIAQEMGLDENRVKTVRLGALLHDIGKIGTYDTLLDKLTGLTDEEYELVKGHPDRGADALAAIDQLKEVIPLIRYHHEHYDGTGYPHHIDHDAIPLAARIISVADAYDSMTAVRPYQPSAGKEFALAELERGAGSQFDPAVVTAFFRVLATLNKDS